MCDYQPHSDLADLAEHMPTYDVRDVFARSFADQCRTRECELMVLRELGHFCDEWMLRMSERDVLEHTNATLMQLVRVLYGLGDIKVQHTYRRLVERVEDRLSRAERRGLQDVLFALTQCARDGEPLCMTANRHYVRWINGKRIQVDTLLLWFCASGPDDEPSSTLSQQFHACPITGTKCANPSHRRARPVRLEANKSRHPLIPMPVAARKRPLSFMESLPPGFDDAPALNKPLVLAATIPAEIFANPLGVPRPVNAPPHSTKPEALPPEIAIEDFDLTKVEPRWTDVPGLSELMTLNAFGGGGGQCSAAPAPIDSDDIMFTMTDAYNTSLSLQHLQLSHPVK